MSKNIVKNQSVLSLQDLASDDVIRYSIRLSSELWLQCQKKALDDGYGARGINKWIIDSIDKLIVLEPTHRNQIIHDVAIKEVSYGKSGNYGIRLSNALKERVWHVMMESALSGKDLDPPIFLEPSYAMVIKAAMINGLMED